MNAPFDFPEEHRDPKAFLDCDYARQICDLQVEGEMIFSPANMNDREVREALLNDILGVTVYEMQSKHQLGFDEKELLRFVSQDQHARILQQLQHEEIKYLLDIQDHQIRVRNDPVLMQAAMDYAGVWFTGYVMPFDALKVNRDNFPDDLQDLAASLSMDVYSNAFSSNTVN